MDPVNLTAIADALDAALKENRREAITDDNTTRIWNHDVLSVSDYHRSALIRSWRLAYVHMDNVASAILPTSRGGQMSMTNTWVSTHHHTTYSFQDGFGTPDQHLARAAELGWGGWTLWKDGSRSPLFTRSISAIF
jgi:hypothetical protein